MKSVCLAVICVAGCGYHPDAATGDDDAPLPIDAPPIDVNGDITQLCTTWQSKLLAPCDLMTPDNGLQLDVAYIFNSDNGEMRDGGNLLFYKSTQTLAQPNGPDAALINVTSFGIGPAGRLVLSGSKPVVIASWGEVIIDGTLDAGSLTAEIEAGSHVDGPVRIGAGANQACGGGTGQSGAAAVATGGSGGGGGGALRGDGGDGAIGDVGSGNRPGGPGGNLLAAAPAFVRGGCAGGPSGVAGPSTSVGAGLANVASLGGDGGGGVGLAALTSITVNAGAIVVAGGGGGSGPQNVTANGGGGGGSGGMIVLDSIAITIAGTITANGGGGGSAACFADSGDQGDNAQSAAVAIGGNSGVAGESLGANGSAAAALTGANATNPTSACGGGGGGGGAGFISFYPHGGAIASNGSTVSPAAQIDPN